MASLNFEFNTPLNSSTHVVFQPSKTTNGDIIKQLNTTTNDFQKLSYNGTLFTYENNVSSTSRTDTYTINIGTSDYIYFHLVILPTTALFYGIKADHTVTLLKTFSPSGAVSSSYDKIYFYGDIKLSYFLTLNKTQTQTEINATLAYNYKPEWTSDTIALCDFTDLSAGATKSLSSWNVYKTKTGDTVAKFVGSVPVGQRQIEDFTCAKNTQEYIFSIYPTSEFITGSPLTSNSVVLDDWRWSLTSTVSKKVMFFELDVQTNPFSNTTDVYEYKGFTQYNKIAQGQNDFLKGGLTCTFGTVNDSGEYVATIEQFNALREFINDKSPKILKGRDGMIGIYHTTMDNKQYDDKSVEQVFKVSINFTEIDDVSSYQVFN